MKPRRSNIEISPELAEKLSNRNDALLQDANDQLVKSGTNNMARFKTKLYANWGILHNHNIVGENPSIQELDERYNKTGEEHPVSADDVNRAKTGAKPIFFRK